MIIHGKDIYISTVTTTQLVVAAAKACTVNVEADTEEVASATNSKYREFRAGRKAWSVSIAHFVTLERWRDLLRTGNSIYVQLNVRSKDALPFAGYVNDVTVQQLSPMLENPTIYYDGENDYFVAKSDQDLYYRSWVSPNSQRYINPSYGDWFSYNGDNYYWDGAMLNKVAKIGGNAIIKKCSLSAAVNGLAQGSIELQGNGPLTDSTAT